MRCSGGDTIIVTEPVGARPGAQVKIDRFHVRHRSRSRDLAQPPDNDLRSG